MNKRWIFTGLGVIAAIIVLSGSLFIVREGEYKVVLKFGEAVRYIDEPGMNLKIPFIESVTHLPKYQMVYDSKPTPILTKDKKPIVVDNYTVWRIDDPQKFLRKFQSVAYSQERIDAAVYSTVRRKLSEIDYGNIISENTSRGDLTEQITSEVSAGMEENGIKIIDVRIKRTDLPEENKQSVYSRMVSDRQSIATRYLSEGDEESRKITSKADRAATELIAQAQSDAKKILADGEQQAAKIYNDAYGKNPEFYKLYRTLESYITTFQGEPVIMLPIDSDYTKILLGK
ncbi:protein HflC [Paenibacillus baekrokdamisoli]|uniref:Protein HflC n=1 Tax=Paenibacillus baekrokdamisoli TaxID=1712516 RepID=A0A3G9IN67_9BACL|nr:protease modulator HflC [Paenibacillus baekrokdamisoli]MBB3071985.1 membrane protease subunit HflC [Paenibacillus baekrokdamisoli]BBH20290.1 protein HflC [Paenibacillus baekrokdamisoli]